MRWTSVFACAVCALLPLGGMAGAQQRQASPEPAALLPQIWWGRADAADLALIQSRQQAINHLLDIYNFSYQHWEVHKLLCGCLRHYEIYEGMSTNEYEQMTEFVMAVPAAGTAGAVSLIPVWYDGSSFDGNADDLHNVAIFNRIVEAEQPQLASARDWMTWALVYLALCGQQPQIVDGVNRDAVARPRLAKSGTVPELPQVAALAGGGTALEFLNFNEVAQLVRWNIDFDAQGRIREVRLTALTKPNPPQ